MKTRGASKSGVPLGRYPYRVVYTLHDDEIVVLRVRHGAREPIDRGALEEVSDVGRIRRQP